MTQRTARSSGLYSGRRKIIWKKIRGVEAITALLGATALGAGLLPFAPGTMGTAAAMPLAYVTRDCSVGWRIFLWLGLTLFGTWSATVFDRLNDTSDNQNI